MDEFKSERSKPWNMYTESPHSPPQTGGDGEGPWKNFGTSMNAISFGFVATAVLISMFLIMAIFEHLFRPNDSFPMPQQNPQENSRPMHKLVDPQPHVSSHNTQLSDDGTIALNQSVASLFVTGTHGLCIGFFSIDAGPSVPYLHCTFSTPTLFKRRSASAFQSST